MDSLALFLQYVISGITSGSVYAIVGVCWSIVFLVTGIVNFATGEFVMLGGMLAFVFIEAGLGLYPSIALAVAGTIGAGLLLERLTLRPVRLPSEASFMVITIAAASIIRGVVLLLVDSESHPVPALVDVGNMSVFGATMTGQTLIVIGTLVVVTVGLSLFFNKTLFGKALRAIAISREAAALIGIRTERLSTFCFGLAGGLGALAGIVIAPITFTSYSSGVMTGVKGLVGALVGGWTITGTVIASLVLGLLEGLFGGFVSSGWKDAIALLAMIVFLVYRTFVSAHRVKKG